MIMGSFDLPQIDYFKSKNSYIGSLGNFQYKLEPIDDALKASVWYGIMCYEKSEITAEQEFALEEAGLQAAVAWLEEQKERPEENER